MTRSNRSKDKKRGQHYVHAHDQPAPASFTSEQLERAKKRVEHLKRKQRARRLTNMAAVVVFNISPGSLVEQLKEYAAQANLSVLYKYTVVPEYTARPALSGEMSDDTALRHLIEGTPLTIEHTTPHTVTLKAPEDDARVIDGVRYTCVPTAWVSGIIFTRLGSLLWRMGEFQSDLYCTPINEITAEAE